MRRHLPLLLSLAVFPGCNSARTSTSAASPPLGGALPADELIQPGEEHFAHLWRVTRGVDNAAEGYWSFDGTRLCLQAEPNGIAGDRIFVLERDGAARQVSNGRGVTTCSYFLPGDRELFYASTHAWHADCPPKPDHSQGYVWAIRPEYDLYVQDLASGRERALTTSWGYDAEATVSPLGDRMVFTSTRSGDLELWTAKLDGSDLRQVTDAPGYDGGAFYSHDGTWLVFRSTAFTPGKEAAERADYQRLLSQWLVRPTRMEIMLVRPDGSERKQVTRLGKASFAPYFFPDDRRIVFATNAFDQNPRGRNFELAAVDPDGTKLERITKFDGFDGFPMFSPDGKWFVFASNRGGSKEGETNLFVAQWK